MVKQLHKKFYLKRSQAPGIYKKERRASEPFVSSQKSQAQFATLGGTLNTLKWATGDDVMLGDCYVYKQLVARLKRERKLACKQDNQQTNTSDEHLNKII